MQVSKNKKIVLLTGNLIENQIYRRNQLLRTFEHAFAAVTCGTLTKVVTMRHHILVLNKKSLDEAMDRRIEEKRPLLTFSNHHACIDDFLLFGVLYKYSHFLTPSNIRWSISAADVCFNTRMSSHFFGMGKGIPVWRTVRDPNTLEIKHQGEGINQPSMDFSLDLMNEGEWIHIYPQGRIIMPNERHLEESQRLKWGIGRLIAESKKSPILLPIYHLGADEIGPIVQPYWLEVLKRMIGKPRHFTILIGMPFILDDEQRTLTKNESENDFQNLYSKLAAVCQTSLYELKKKAEKEHAQHISLTST